MPQKYARLALDRSLADAFYNKVKTVGRKPSEVLTWLVSASIDAIDHGMDPVDIIHMCRMVRTIGLGKAGYDVGKNAGAVLKTYYTPRQFLEILSRIGPVMLGAQSVGPGVYRVKEEPVRETLRGLFEGLGCRCEAKEEFLHVHCEEG